MLKPKLNWHIRCYTCGWNFSSANHSLIELLSEHHMALTGHLGFSVC